MRLLTHKNRPVQFIFAGKAHPADVPGKELIRQIIHFASSSEEIRRRIVFIEDYDINVARYLVQGVDVWLNTPRRPLEASGTSGMKAAVNGALNVSILDGWWDEAYAAYGDKDIGWAIGGGETYGKHEQEYEDEVESRALFNLFEKEIVPAFYERGTDDLPHEWIARMKSSMDNLAPDFNTNRMVEDYSRRFYIPASGRWRSMKTSAANGAAQLAEWKKLIRANWKNVKLDGVEADDYSELSVGEHLKIRARVSLGKLAPKDVVVEAYHGPVDTHEEIVEGKPAGMDHVSTEANVHLYEGTVPAVGTGKHGFAVRVIPVHENLITPHDMGLVLWSS